MKISEKDATLVMLLLIVLIGALFYFIPYKSIDKQKIALSNELMTLESQYNLLSVDLAKEEEYTEGIEEFEKTISTLDAQLPPLLNQELILYTLNDIENKIDLKFPNISLGEVTEIGTLNDDPALPGQETVIGVDVTLDTELSYVQLKGLLNYLYTDENGLEKNNRIVLNNLQLSSDPEDGILKANFTLSFLGLNWEGREARNVDLGNFEQEKDNVFTPYEGYGINTVPDVSVNFIDDYADFFVLLDPITVDNMAMTVGKAHTDSVESYLYSDKNELVDLEMDFYQTGNHYYYRYKLDGDSYPANYSEGIAFDPESAFELVVISSSRNGFDDKNGVNAHLINNTDMPLDIVYFSEDAANPRFNVVETKGEINIR